jgi:FAD/FMN-containing dehydrogenase
MDEPLTRRELTARLVAGGAALAVPGWVAIGEAGAARSKRLRQLAASVKGPVLTPRNSAGIVFNSRYAGIKPLAVVRAAGPNDVQACVRWAARHGVRITARSGGHSYAGYSTADNGLVVDLRRLDKVSLSGRTVTAGPGTNLIEFYAALARRGATVPGGSCPTVGLGGLALGGGMGLAGREFGLTCDNITGLQIVTADGRLRRADADTNRDLFWACRGGGGGNFGIVTKLELRAHRVSSAAWYSISWPWSQAGEALAAWQQFAPDAPRALTALFTLAGNRRVTSIGQFFGSEAALRRLLRPLLRVSGAQLTAGTSDYLRLMQHWAGCSNETVAECDRFSPQPFDAGSDYVAKPLPPRGRAAAISAAERGGTLLFDAYGGAINRVAPGATAFVHRRQLFAIQYYSPTASQSWVASARKAMAPFVSGQCYQNYIDPQLDNWQRAYYGSNLDRLRAIKKSVDPDDVFRFKQAI